MRIYDLVIDTDVQKSIIDLYIDGFKVNYISRLFDLDGYEIRNILRENGMIKSAKFEDITGKKFGRWTVKKYDGCASNSSRWVCQCACGTVRSVKKYNLVHGLSLSCGCLNNDLRNRKSAVMECSKKYKYIYAPTHPNASKQGFVGEHILIMSEHLGRPLEKGEIVHHKNGIRTDNGIDNLELCCKNHPPSQRIDDLIDFCIQFLLKYRPDLLS